MDVRRLVELYGDEERALRTKALEERKGVPYPFTTPGPEVNASHYIHGGIKLNESSLFLVGSATPWSITETSILYFGSWNLRRGPQPWLRICVSNIIIPFWDEYHVLLLGGILPVADAVELVPGIQQECGYTQIINTITMTFEEGSSLMLGGQSACDIFSAVPLPPRDNIERILTLLLGCAEDINQTGFIVEKPYMFRNYVNVEEKERDSNVKALRLELEGKIADGKLQGRERYIM